MRPSGFWLQASGSSGGLGMGLRLLLMLALLLLALSPAASPHPARAGHNATAVSITKSITVAADAWNHIGMAHGNHGDCGAAQPSLKVEGTSADDTRTLLRFDLSTQVPTGSTLSSATLNLFYYGWKNANPSGRTYYVDRITETDWVEGTACHGTQTGSSDWIDRVHSTLAWTTAGGTYTATDEATALVPSAVDNWMTWTVTNQVVYAVTNGVAAHFIIRDPDAASKAQARFRSREVPGSPANPPYLSVTYTAPWDSYSDAARTTFSDSFAGNNTTVYMRGTGFSTAQTYNVGYYDAVGTDGRVKKAQEGPLTATGGTLDSSYLLNTDPNADAGTWNAVAYPSTVTPPTTYTADGSRVADDQFTVDASAIPEFPDVLAGIGVAGLCAGVFFWLRRRSQKPGVRSQKPGARRGKYASQDF